METKKAFPRLRINGDAIPDNKAGFLYKKANYWLHGKLLACHGANNVTVWREGLWIINTLI